MTAPIDHTSTLMSRLGALDLPEAVRMLTTSQTCPAADVDGLLERTSHMIHSDPPLALHLTKICATVGSEIDQPHLSARATYQQAQIAADRGEPSEALSLIQKAREDWRVSGSELEALRTDLGRIQVLDDLGRHEHALRVGLALVEGLDRLTPADGSAETVRLIRAHATENLGTTYGSLGRHTDALAAYRSAEAGYRALGKTLECAPPLAGRGIELLDLGRPREALEALEAADAIFAEAGDRLFEAQCQGDRARAHRQLGEIAPSLRLLEQARRTLEELGAWAEATRLRLALAETYLDVGLWPEALAEAHVAVAALEQAEMPHDLAMARYVLALSRLALGQTEAGTEDLDQAAQLLASVNDLQHQARVRLARVEARIDTQAIEISRSQLSACITELRDGGWLIPLAHAYLRQADLAADDQGTQDALDVAEELIRALALPEPTYQLHLRRGRWCRRQGREAQAEIHLRQAIDELAHVSSALPDHVLVTGFHAERFAAHSELVGLLLSRGQSDDIAQACRLADESKSRTLVELLGNAAGVGPDLATSEPQLSETYHELSASYLALERASDPDERVTLRHRIQQLQDRVQALRLRHPQERPVSSHPTQVDSPRKTLPDADDVDPVIAYYDVDGDIVIFVRVHDRVLVRTVPEGMSVLHSLLDDLDDQWSRAALSRNLNLGQPQVLLRSAQDCLSSLYAVLIKPVRDLIPRGASHLCVVPHSPMGAIPFHALFDGHAYLMQRWAITLAPTISSIGPHRSAAPIAEHSAVVAVPDEHAPAVLAEAKAVAAHLPAATLLLGQEATVEAVVAVVPEIGLLHIACHGVHPDGSPLFARLRLGDRWMTSIEIVRLDLRGALVTLSACVTGKHGRDRESIGLAWAFLAAGAGGVLSSQWAVDDEAAAVLMDELYRRMARGAAPHDALRSAQLHTAEQFPHPFAWAPFTFITGAYQPQDLHSLVKD